MVRCGCELAVRWIVMLVILLVLLLLLLERDTLSTYN